MILKSRRGREFVKDLAKPIVARLAPGELQDFDELAEDFFADPELEGDETLGCGVDLLPDLVVILMFVATALEHLLPSTGWGKWRLKNLSGTPTFQIADVKRSFAVAEEAIERLQGESRVVREELDLMKDLLRGRLLDERSRVGILFLGANPETGKPIRVDWELRQVAQAIREAPLRDRIVLNAELAVTVDDLHRSLLAFRPQLVHFGGHGRSGSILVEGHDGAPREVSAASLSRLFQVLENRLRCVVLNACYSERQAEAIASHAAAVIGMTADIDDAAAASFSRAFYRALAYGENLQTAFDLGCAQIDMDGFPEDAEAPRVIALRQNPRDIVLV